MGPQNSERSVDPSNFSKISVLNFRKKYRLRDLKKKIKLLIKTVPTVTVTVVTEKQFQLGTVSEKQLRLTLQLGTVSEKQLQNRYDRYNSYSRNDPPCSMDHARWWVIVPVLVYKGLSLSSLVYPFE